MKNENIKTVEIRDRATLIPAFAIRMLPSDEKEIFLFKGAGYGISNPCVMLIPISAPWLSARCSEENNIARTLPTAHKWIEENFYKIENGQVIDVEFILGEKDRPSLNSFIEEKIEEFKHLKESSLWHYVLDEDNNIFPTKDYDVINKFVESGRRIICQEEIEDKFISTVMLGVDHDYNWDGRLIYLNEDKPNPNPVIFETMIKCEKEEWLDYQERYRTYKEAEEGHKKAVQWVKDGCKEDEI